jgi:hypothetical protein
MRIPAKFCVPFTIGFLALALPVSSQSQGRYIDLDQLSPSQLSSYLNAELDDVYIGRNAYGEYDLDDLFSLIMEALSDAGDYDSNESDDDSDQGEQVITQANLRAEMAEDGVRLEDVVWGALQTADQYSRNNTSGIIKVIKRPDKKATLLGAVSAVSKDVAAVVVD